jgi:uncharacterized damage-inducible protein DinB
MQTMNPLLISLQNAKAWFLRTSSVLEETDSGFAPKPGMYTAAQQVAHVAQTVDWFIEGAFERPDGLDADFRAHMEQVLAVSSLTEARAWLDRAFARAAEVLAAKSDAELNEPFPPNTIMGGAPKRSLVDGIVDHTAHHRGALSVYARLLGKEPPMPYM